MSERYWITGVQLGLLQQHEDVEKRKKLVDEIIDKQFIGNFYSEEGQQDFKKKMLAIEGEKRDGEE